MTVAELIAALRAYPPELRVLVDGYEGGFDDAFLKTRQIDPEPDKSDRWQGDYRERDGAPWALVVARIPD